MDKGFKKLLDEASSLQELKKKIFNFNSDISDKDIAQLKSLSDKGYHQAYMLLGIASTFGLGMPINPYTTDFYFQKLLDSKDVDNRFLFQIANYYAGMGDEWKNKALLALNLAAQKGHPIAIGMVKRMEEDPFDITQA